MKAVSLYVVLFLSTVLQLALPGYALAEERWDVRSDPEVRDAAGLQDAREFFPDFQDKTGFVRLGPQNRSSGRGRLADVPPVKVELVVADWCPYCTRLERFLNDRNIRYTRLDIDSSVRARRVHKELGGGGIPVTRIGETIIRGYKPDAILEAVDESSGA